ncbi:hypothetical protein CCMSSC00406_0008895 [Pleurotus cornucopiae]|uniref:Uncharacterized protein n=1 Tax=Pleurotus cornucopiae TaxID=5321 RepID=A0ACB7IT22_PLECO|nr:hypothetical protein CCMSSC00406_0008895 [Pleurotus cornucopiae]
MFDFPSGDATPDRLTDEQPLRLDDIDRVDFCNLLKYLYPKGISTPVLLTLDQWLAVLKLSTLWEMEDTRTNAIRNIPELVADPTRWLGLAIGFDVEVWFVPAMNKLIQRAEPISMADLSHIGIECALGVAAIREVCHSSHAGGSGSYLPPQAVRGAVTYNSDDRIQQEFKEYLTTPLLLADKVITASDANETEIPSEDTLTTIQQYERLEREEEQEIAQAMTVAWLMCGYVGCSALYHLMPILEEKVVAYGNASDGSLQSVVTQSTMSDEAALPSRRNSNFYLECITFKVEDELFKIPIRCITFDTEPFKTLASRSLPTGDGPVEGTSDEHPIILPDTSKGDFERLLEVLCPLNFKPKAIASTEVWESVLKLSTKWRLLDVRRYAIETMNTLNLSHGEMVRYGRDYRVSNWLIKGYLGFATRESPLDEGDVNDVFHGVSLNGGIHRLVRIATLRERKEAFGTSTAPDGTCPSCNYGHIRCDYCGSATDHPKKTMVDEGMIRTSFQVEVDEIVIDEKCFYHE